MNVVDNTVTSKELLLLGCSRKASEVSRARHSLCSATSSPRKMDE